MTTPAQPEQATRLPAKAVILDPSTTANGLNEIFADPLCGNVAFKTLLSSSRTPTNALTAGIAVCAKGGGSLNAHSHPQAEMYFFLEGEGVIELDGVQSAVSQGSMIYIPGNAQHSVVNHSEVSDLRWLYVYATDDFSDIQYRWAHLQS